MKNDINIVCAYPGADHRNSTIANTAGMGMEFPFFYPAFDRIKVSGNFSTRPGSPTRKTRSET